MKCSSMKTISKSRFDGHTQRVILWYFIERPPSLGGKSLKYRSRVTIITRSNYSYHFLLSLQLSMSIFVGCLVCLFLVWALFQPHKAGWRSGYKSRPVTEFIIKRKCHSAICLRPSPRPDDREVALKIGKGNHNIADLIIVKWYSRYTFLNYYHYF